jgi:alcohol dehydrogenase
MMKALQLDHPEHFSLVSLPECPPPAANEVHVQIRAIGVCGTDLAGYLGKMPFIQYPRILGHELGVEVLGVGSAVTHLHSGDRCCVEPYLHCGHCHSCQQGRSNCCESLQVLGVHCDGGMRERMNLPASKLHRSNDLQFEQLALVEMLGIGCHAVARATLQSTDDVLILGAGPIGLTVLEFALRSGAAVSIYDLSDSRRHFVQQHYPAATVLAETPANASAQVVFDATGNVHSMAQAFHFARFTGKVVYVGITKEPIPLDDPLFHRRELTLLASRNALPSDFHHILSLITSGQLDTTPWITQRASFEEAPELFAALAQPGSTTVKVMILGA